MRVLDDILLFMKGKCARTEEEIINAMKGKVTKLQVQLALAFLVEYDLLGHRDNVRYWSNVRVDNFLEEVRKAEEVKE